MTKISQEYSDFTAAKSRALQSMTDVSDIPMDGVEGVASPNTGPIGVNGDEMQAVLEVLSEESGNPMFREELEELVASLRNELHMFQKMHGEACRGWSKYQRLHERDQEALRKIRDVTKIALSISLTHAEKGGLLKAIEQWTNEQLPMSNYDDVGDIPF